MEIDSHFHEGSFKAEAYGFAAAHLANMIYPMVRLGEELDSTYSEEFITAQWKTLQIYLKMASGGIRGRESRLNRFIQFSADVQCFALSHNVVAAIKKR